MSDTSEAPEAVETLPETMYEEIDRLRKERDEALATIEQMKSGMRSLTDLRETGMLWLINASVLHPRGLAMALHFNDDLSVATGWRIMAATPGEPFVYHSSMEAEIDARYKAVEALFAEARDKR